MRLLLLLFSTLIVIIWAVNEPIYFNPTWPVESEFRGPFENVALQWSYTTLQLIRLGSNLNGNAQKLGSNSFGPVARALVIKSKCELDAWTQSERPLLGNTVSGKWIQAGFPKTSQNTNTALNYATYRALTKTFGTLDARFQPYIDQQLIDLGGSLSLVNSINPSTPHGLGNLACLNVFEGNDLDNDGSNAQGNVPGYSFPYQDYTNFKAYNDPMLPGCKMNCSNLRKGIDVWTPASVVTPNGNVEITWTDTQFTQVKQFAQRRPDNSWYNKPQSRNNSATVSSWLSKNVDIISRSANLGDAEKALGTYWADSEGYTIGQTTILFPMMALIIKARELGQTVSLERTIKLIFVTTHALYDALPEQYSAKVRFHAPRPVNTVQCIYANQLIQAWRGPYLGVGTISGSDWTAYQNKNFCFPPTPEYICGHCTLSGASVQAIARFFKNDTVVAYPRSYYAGQFPLEPKITPGNPGYIAGVTDVPNNGSHTIGYAPGKNITVSDGWKGWTWNQLSLSISYSRVWLGIHFNETSVISQQWGKEIGNRVYDAADLLWSTPRIPILRDFPVIIVTASGKDYILPDGVVSALAKA